MVLLLEFCCKYSGDSQEKQERSILGVRESRRFGAADDRTVRPLLSGKNEKMQAKFEELVGENPNVQVYGYTNEVPELMSISDLVVTKPGGLTITEALASGLPIVVINPIPGQEVENAEFLEKKGVAVWIRKTENPDEAVKELLENPEQIKHMKIRSKLMAKKNSTRDICKILMEN